MQTQVHYDRLLHSSLCTVLASTENVHCNDRTALEYFNDNHARVKLIRFLQHLHDKCAVSFHLQSSDTTINNNLIATT
jgi:hypothetical protein